MVAVAVCRRALLLLRGVLCCLTVSIMVFTSSYSKFCYGRGAQHRTREQAVTSQSPKALCGRCDQSTAQEAQRVQSVD